MSPFPFYLHIMVYIYRLWDTIPVSILYKSIAGRYRPVRVADGPIMARCRFIKNASWVDTVEKITKLYGVFD